MRIVERGEERAAPDVLVGSRCREAPEKKLREESAAGRAWLT